MEKEHSIYWQMYCDVWAYHQRYINNLQDNDKLWHELVEDGKAVSRKYGGNKFIVNLVLNEINEFERKYEEQQKINSEGKQGF